MNPVLTTRVRMAVTTCLLLLCSSRAGAGAWHVVALAGATAPGAGPPAVFQSFTMPALVPWQGFGDSARVAWLATLAIGQGGVSEGVFVGRPDATDLMYRSGITSTPTGALFAAGGTPPALLADGRVTVGHRDSAGNVAIYVWESGTAPVVLARAGDPAPQAPEATLLLPPVSFTPRAAGATVGFYGALEGPGVTESNDLAYWAGTPASISLRVREGDALTDPTNVALEAPSLSPLPPMNAGGHAAFLASPISSSLPTGARDGVYLSGAGGVHAKLARTGEPPPNPGEPPENIVRSLSGPWSLNSANNAVVQGLVETALPPLRKAIWAGAPGAMSLVIAQGQSVYGPPFGGAFVLDIRHPAVINASGEIAVVLDAQFVLPGHGPGSIWIADPRPGPAYAWRRVAFDAGPIPDLPGFTFTNLASSAGALQMNRRGQVCFRGACRDGAGTVRVGLWAGAPDHVVTLVRVGEAIEVAPGDHRVVSSVNLPANASSGGEDGRPLFLNNAGVVSAWLSFTDGTSGLFLTRLPSPCPGDVNGDRAVDFLDLNSVLGSYGEHAPLLAADLNDDGAVDFLDLNEALGAYGSACVPFGPGR